MTCPPDEHSDAGDAGATPPGQSGSGPAPDAAERARESLPSLPDFPEVQDNVERGLPQRSVRATQATRVDDDEAHAMPTATNESLDGPRRPSVRGDVAIDDFVGAGFAAIPEPDEVERGVQAVVADRYELMDMIGQGGMGAVFLAHDRHAECEVAIKMLRPQYAANQGARKRFIDEAKQMNRIPSHAAVLVVKDVGDVDRPYYTMEPMRAGSLGRRLRCEGALDRATALALALDAARAVSYVHEETGAIHRDIKPENVLLADNGSARLCDFGLVRDVGVGTVGLRAGTLAYMPPEVLGSTAKNVGFEWDIYSFGAMLYEMLTGRPPHDDVLAQASADGRSLLEVGRQIADCDPTPIHEANPTADPDLSRIAAWAMAREKRDRYHEIADIVSDLERVQKGETPLGPRQSAAESTASVPSVVQRVAGAVIGIAIMVGIVFGGLRLFGLGGNGLPPIPPTGVALLDELNPDAPFELEVRTIAARGKEVREGDEFVYEFDRQERTDHTLSRGEFLFVDVATPEPCYLTALFTKYERPRTVFQLCPSNWMKPELTTAGMDVTIPSEDGAIIEILPESGTATYYRLFLKIIATREPIEVVGMDALGGFASGDGHLLRVRRAGTTDDASSLTELLGVDGWSSAEVLVITGPGTDSANDADSDATSSEDDG